MLILQTLQGLLTKKQYFWKLVILKKCLVSFCIFYRLNVDINLHLSEIIVMERIFLHIHPIKNSYKTCFKKSSMTLQVYTCKVMDDFRTKSWKSCHRFYKIRHGKYQSRTARFTRNDKKCKIDKISKAYINRYLLNQKEAPCIQE